MAGMWIAVWEPHLLDEEDKSKIYATKDGKMSDGQDAFNALLVAEDEMAVLVQALDQKAVSARSPDKAREINENNSLTSY